MSPDNQFNVIPDMRKIRLPLEIYREKFRLCSITICSQDKNPVFLNHNFVNELLYLIKTESENNNLKVLAFYFMSDHLHLIIATLSGFSIIDWVRDSKAKQQELDGNMDSKVVFFKRASMTILL